MEAQINGWQKLLQKKPAVFGLLIIAAALVVATLAYWLVVDASPDANRMIVEIGGRKPGFTQTFFLQPKTVPPGQRNWIAKTLYGQPDTVQYIPIIGYEVAGDTVTINKFIDDELSEPLLFAIGSLKTPLSKNFTTIHFYLGTDKYGRDMLSRLLLGVRASLSVGGIAMILSLTIGLLLGSFAGYYGGKTDGIIMWLINVIWSIPTLLLVFAITLLLGKGFWQVFIAVGLTMWVNVARLVRGQLLGIRQLEYVEAARALGYSDLRIIGKHILPNILGPVMVVAAANFASAIIIEAGLSFLGVGVQPPQPSWGGMIKENYNFIITNNPMLALAPGFAIMLLVLAFNLLGNGIRDALDVRA
jgi:ABC-type dipeptide/oligopeptide/nickel transport system permease subunit